jgi:ribose 5-phosphate isomerase B
MRSKKRNNRKGESMTPGAVLIASDHAGFTLKQLLRRHLEDKGWTVEDLGANSQESCDYPQFADALCQRAILSGRKGILVCGSGVGMSIAANRHKGIRAALCTHEFHAAAARAHNDANVLCLGERVTAPALACLLADIFLDADFEGGRHQRRLDLIDR